MSNAEEIESQRRRMIESHGEWRAHNIELAQEVFTPSAAETPGCPALFPIVNDFAKKPIAQMRVLDLGCLEGLYAVEFARRGAELVGIEEDRDDGGGGRRDQHNFRSQRLQPQDGCTPR